MTKHFENFGSQTTGVTPAGWTHESAEDDWTATAEDDAGAEGGKILRITNNGSITDANYLQYTASNPASGACEAACRWRIIAGGVNNASEHLPLACIFLQAGTPECYAIAWRGNLSRFDLARINSPSGSVGASLGNAAPFTPVVGGWNKSRIRRTSTGVFRARIWADAASELDVINDLLTAASQPTVVTIAEAKDIPQAWHINTAIETTFTSGALALGAYAHNVDPDYDWAGLAWDQDDVAPTAPLSQPTIAAVGDGSFRVGQTGITAMVANAGEAQGNGRFRICPSDDIDDVNGVDQTITAWADDEITFDVVRGDLPVNTPLFAFVESDSGESNAEGFPVQLLVPIAVLAYPILCG